MTTFKEIRGKLIRTLDTDPTPATNYEGQIWYNKTIGVLKGASPVAATFSAGGSMSTGRRVGGAAGIQTAGLAFGGRSGPTLDMNVTEEYDGSAWTSGGNLNRARRVMGRGTGTQTAALAHGGHYGSPQTSERVAEEYNGTAWTNAGTSSSDHDGGAQAGTQTAGIQISGSAPPGPVTAVENYDGTSWTSGTATPSPAASQQGAAAGTQTAALFTQGSQPPAVASNASFEYDGATWTSGGNRIISVLLQGGTGGGGLQTLALDAGGFNGTAGVTNSQLYDGTSWASDATLSTAKYSAFAQGPTSSFFTSGGEGDLTATEEYNQQFVGTKTLTTS